MNYYVDAIYDQGMLRPLEPLGLPDQSRVKLRIETEEAAQVAAADANVKAEGKAPTLLERLQQVAGAIDDLPQDSSTNLDHYLYGVPKRSEQGWFKALPS